VEIGASLDVLEGAVAGIPPMDHPAHGLVTNCANPAPTGPQMVTEFL